MTESLVAELPSVKKRSISLAFDETTWASIVAKASGEPLGRYVERLLLATIAGPQPAMADGPRASVSQVAAAFREYGEDPPKPALLAKWVKLLGGPNELVELVRSMGMKGHLAKGHAYVAGAVLKEHQRKTVVQRKVALNEQYTDGETLDTGYRWSKLQQKWVPPSQWFPA